MLGTLLKKVEFLMVTGKYKKKKKANNLLLKQNCWEFIKCGREPGGEKAAKLGICLASIDISADGLNEGKNGGRICWAICGTFCGKKMQCFFAKKQLSCRACIFFKKVKEEEGIQEKT